MRTLNMQSLAEVVLVSAAG